MVACTQKASSSPRRRFVIQVRDRRSRKCSGTYAERRKPLRQPQRTLRLLNFEIATNFFDVIPKISTCLKRRQVSRQTWTGPVSSVFSSMAPLSYSVVDTARVPSKQRNMWMISQQAKMSFAQTARTTLGRERC
jgi:hypothetical protein